jgi:glycosyltransferase involved in cell wall biosynthesis
VTTVGVALATYNGAPFIEQQLTSILMQTRPPDRIVVTDDASSDDTVARVERALEGSAVDVEILRNSERVGAVRNFERALRRVGTDVVVLADQDDVWRADKVSRLLQLLENDGSIALAFSNGRLIDSDGRPLPGSLWARTGFDRRQQRAWLHGDPFDVLLRRTVAPGASMVVRTSLLTAALPLPDSAWHDDWLMLLAAAGGRVAYIDEPLIDYRLHASNAVGLVQESVLDRLHRRTTLSRHARLAGDVDRLRDLAVRLDALGLQNRLARVARAREHAGRRLATAGRPLPRTLRVVGSGWIRGDYRAYSNGWRSAVADLMDGRLHRRVPADPS